MHGAVTDVENGTREMRADFIIIEFAVTRTLDSLKGRCSTPSGVFWERILTDHVCRILERCIEVRVVDLLYILFMCIYIYIHTLNTII